MDKMVMMGLQVHLIVRLKHQTAAALNVIQPVELALIMAREVLLALKAIQEPTLLLFKV